MKSFKSSCLICLFILVSSIFTPLYAAGAPDSPLIVYAAASLTNVLNEISSRYAMDSGHHVKCSYGASSALARQIEAGAQADIYFSADTDWMDYLQQHHLINSDSRENLLGNALVLIAPADSAIKLKIHKGFALAATLGKERLAVADTHSVPAGMYARAALSSLGVWTQVSDKLVQAENVRVALAYVDRAEVPLGIVYETDAMIDNKVRIVDRFPVGSYPAIVYPVALTTSAKADAKEFIAYLHSPVAVAIFKKYGFTLMKQQ